MARRCKRLAPLLGLLVLAALLADGVCPRGAWADDDLDALKKENALLQTRLEIAKAQQELGKIEASAEKDQVDAVKALADAQAAMSKSKMAQKFAGYTAVQEILGETKTQGKGGEVTAEDSKIPFLLWTKIGGAALLSQAAGEVCLAAGSKLGGAKAILVPNDLPARRKAAMLFEAHLDALEELSNAMAATLWPGGSKDQMQMKMIDPLSAAATTLTAVTIGQSLLNSVSTLSKSLQTDRAILASNEAKDDLLATMFMLHDYCATVVERVDVEEAALDGARERFKALDVRVIALRNSLERWTKAGKEAAEAVQKATAAVDKATSAKQKEKEKAALLKCKEELASITAFNGLGAALQAFISAATPEVIAATASTQALLSRLGNSPDLTFRLEAQDLQIHAESFWKNGVRGVSGISLAYRLGKRNGDILAAGYVGLSSREEKKNWDKSQEVLRHSPSAN